ncbi:phenoloxidase 2-like [Anopheles merus]|uniref:Tyrosinase copper-binding domain-containing protein n=1 Tax=Anopheles merus TaxID=30066 RepID=A0A182V3A8_ANOME|nr:phenoloxidase 2-like [Anopheles merus]
MATLTQKFHGLLQHPLEPLFLPKNDGTLFYDIPERFLTSRYSPIGQNLANRFGPNSSASSQVSNDTGVPPTVVTIKDLDELPDLMFATWIKRRDSFSLFNPEHRKAAGKLTKLFLDQPDANRLVDVAAYARDRLNAPLFQYALSVALLHRPDTKSVSVPSLLHLFPDQFIDPAAQVRMMEEGSIVLDENRMAIPIPMNYTATDAEPEQRMAFFREDIGVNLHHWHWHLVYPASGPPEVVRKDRRGELFYYMHQQLLARYQIDRFAQGLGRIEPLANLREPVREAYYPKLLRTSNNRTFCPRYPGMMISDVARSADRLEVRIADIESWLPRVLEAIDAGFAVSDDGVRVPLDETRGIDVLGNILERSVISINRNLYGDVHNMGHVLLAFIHDPRGTYLESSGVMGGVATAMRDPIFYRWHKFIDNIFLRNKARLAPYTTAELSNSNVTLEALETQLDRAGGAVNSFVTFWQRSQVDLRAGIDFSAAGSAFVSFTHLQCAPFVYRLRINSTARSNRQDTVRIFLLPRQNEQGRPLSFEDRRLLAIELDSFRVNLRSGMNNIVRQSSNTSVTIPFERTFGNVEQANAGNAQSRFCGCGWPAHMLLPKGNVNGIEFDLFAMVSRFEDDNANVNYDENAGCDDSYAFCGLRDRVYPSRRAMGFPFDRRASNGVRSVADFVAPYKNMRLATVTLRFMNTIIDRPTN